MDDIRGMLDRLSDLSETELNELEENIIQSFTSAEAQEISRDSVAEMTFLADSVESVRAEMAKREAEKAELAAQASEAATRITAEPITEEVVEEDPAATAPPETFSTAEAPSPTVTAGGDMADKEDEEEEPLPAIEGDALDGAAVEEAIAEMDAEAEAESEDEDEGKEKVAVFATEGEPAAAESEPAVAESAAVEAELATIQESPATVANESTESTEAHMDKTATEPVFSAPSDRLPVARTSGPQVQVSLVAGGDIPGISAGSSLRGRNELAEAMSMRLHSLRRASGGSGEQVVVASLAASFPEERTLRGNEVDSNSEKIKSVTSPTAVVASGGFCAPLPVNYDIFNLGGSTDTPLRDSLATFNADRGGVRFVKPPVLSDYVGSVGKWTNADDIEAAMPGSTKKKGCLTVQCASEEEVFLDAITSCLCFGNMQTRAFPELIAQHNDMAMVYAARYMEMYIYERIKAQSTAVSIPAVLGTARDLLISVERAATALRYKHRLNATYPLRYVAPQWVHSMIRSDLTAQLPGDGMDTTFSLADAAINRFFTERNLRPTWTLEGLGDVPTVTDYPDDVEWGLFPEGTFTLLDGGSLDVGIVRDMNLVQKNDYCMFTEQFLGVAMTGQESLWVTQALNVNGGSAGTLDVAAVDY